MFQNTLNCLLKVLFNNYSTNVRWIYELLDSGRGADFEIGGGGGGGGVSREMYCHKSIKVNPVIPMFLVNYSG